VDQDESNLADSRMGRMAYARRSPRLEVVRLGMKSFLIHDFGQKR
jgi:hypothetical protein